MRIDRPELQPALILGCGYVGSAVARRWLDRGIPVWGVSRNEETLGGIRHENFTPVVAEVDSRGWHEKVPAECGWVLNCVSSAGGGMEGYLKSYVGGNRSLLDWLETADANRIVYTSSTAVYPFTDGRDVFEEDAGGDLAKNGEVVLDSENVLREGRRSGDRTTILRLSGIYGPGRHYLLDSLRRGNGVIPGRGDYFLNLIHREDIASAVDAVLASGETAGKTYNLSDGSPALKEEVLRWLAEQLDMPPPAFDPNAVGRRMRINSAGDPPNRRVRVDRLMEATGWKPIYPDYRAGFRAIMDEQL